MSEMILDEKTLGKLKKLHALANCPTGNENEIKAAAGRMAEMLVSLGISEAELSFGEEKETKEEKMVNEHFFSDQKNISTWQDWLLGSIAKANQCKVIEHTSKMIRGKKIKVYGTEGNVAAVKYILQYCMAQIELYTKLWARRTGLTGKTQTTSHKAGLARGIGEQIRASMAAAKQAASDSGKGMALVRYESNMDLVNEYVNQMVRNLKTIKPKKVHVDMNAYEQGLDTGRNMHLDFNQKKALETARKALTGR